MRSDRAMSKKANILALFHNHEQVAEAVGRLEQAGIDIKKLSVITGERQLQDVQRAFTSTSVKPAKGGESTPPVWPSKAVVIWIPGVGRLVVTGPLMNTLVETLEGAVVVKGLSAVGAALLRLGVPRRKVSRYEVGLATDDLLVAHVDLREVDRAYASIDMAKPTETEVVNNL
jgi:hypothetical protein